MKSTHGREGRHPTHTPHIRGPKGLRTHNSICVCISICIRISISLSISISISVYNRICICICRR